jgi:hypothetical protein
MMSRMKAQLLLLMFVVWFLFLRESAAPYGAGVLAPEEPIQQTASSKSPFSFKDHTIIPLALFHTESRVLSVERYRFDPGAKLSPVDLVLGWGRMSDESVLKEIDIRQNGRWYHWQSQTLPIPVREIETHSANMHMIPANREVERVLLDVKKGDIVRLDGYLIRAEGANGSRWVSSLSRTDTGAHACEVVFVKRLEIVELPVDIFQSDEDSP